MPIRLVLIFTLLCLAGCSAYVPFSGGRLEGTTAPIPAAWTEVARADVVKLETRKADPYSVKLWIIGSGTSLYVHAGDNRAEWVEHIEVDPDVRLLVDGLIYELAAARVTDAAEFATFSDRYEAKYGRRPGNENVAQAYLFRLAGR